MKKITILSFIVVALVACNNDGSKEETKDSTATEKKEGASDLSNNPDYQKGIALIGQSDCLTCHKIDEKLQGPAYRDVANKYASMPDTIVTHLAGKIIKGGSGVWGEIPMTPHPALAEDDAKAMVKYILLLKK
jgi:cytochrome c